MITIRSIFLIYLFTYFMFYLLGYIAGKLTKIKLTSLRATINKLYEPITINHKKEFGVAGAKTTTNETVEKVSKSVEILFALQEA